MSEIEKMKRYIERTDMKLSDRYQMGTMEALTLAHHDDWLDAILLAFNYGQAKGYRAAKAKMKEANA